MIKERLKQLFEEKDVTPYRVSKETSITRTTIGNYIDGKTEPNKSNIGLLANYFRVNEDWLLTGNGEKYLNSKLQSEPYLTTKSGTKYYEMANGLYRMRVPLVTEHAYAKYIDEFRDAEFLDRLEETEFIVDKIGLGRYFAFKIKGESMDDGSIKSIPDQSTVLVRELSQDKWTCRLHTEKYPNWIIVLDNTILCKQIIDQDFETGEITCHSLNPSPEYSDFKINLNEVNQLLNIIQKTLPAT